MSLALTAVWNFLKNNWQVVVLVVALAAGYAWIRQQQADTAHVIEQMNDAHQVEVEKINNARTIEQTEHAQQLKILQDSIAKIQTDYVAAQKQLEEQQAAQRSEIVKKYSDDSAGLAQLAAEKLGLEVVPTGPQ